jgi:hypothetical protein
MIEVGLATIHGTPRFVQSCGTSRVMVRQPVTPNRHRDGGVPAQLGWAMRTPSAKLRLMVAWSSPPLDFAVLSRPKANLPGVRSAVGVAATAPQSPRRRIVWVRE